MRWPTLLLCFAAPLTACAAESSFYSFASRAFVPLSQVPVRKELVGTWRRNDGGDLVLRPDGKFSSARMGGGCWDVEGRKFLMRPACVNYGADKNSVILTISESTDECSFQLRGQLVLSNCIYAGHYARDDSPRRPKG